MKGEQKATEKLRLMLLSLVCCFRLLSLDHASAHNAVKTAKVEEGNGAKQTHRNNLLKTLCDRRNWRHPTGEG